MPSEFNPQVKRLERHCVHLLDEPARFENVETEIRLEMIEG